MSSEIPLDAQSLLASYDLTGTDTAFPILEAGVVDFVVSEITVEPQKSGAGHNMTIKLKTTMPWKTRGEGVTKPPGFPLRDTISLVATDKYNPAQKLAQFKEAVLGDKSGPFGAPEAYVGKPVTARIKIESSEQYGDSNRVQAYVKRR